MSSKPIETAFATACAHPPYEAGLAHLPQKSRGSLCAGPASDLIEGQFKIINEGRISIGIYRLEGSYYAIRNQCPHQGAPLCQGLVGNTHAPRDVSVFEPTLEGRVIRCPWHGWEFDIPSGKGLYNLKDRVKVYPTRVDPQGLLWVDL